MKKIKALLSVLLLGSFLVACGKAEEQPKKSAEKELKIVTTFYPMYDFTSHIVGDKGEVSLLIAGDTEPHDYEPSAKDIAKIQDADVFIYNSDQMETWVKAVLKNLDKSQTKVIEASSAIKLAEGGNNPSLTVETDDHDHQDKAAEKAAHQHEEEHDHAHQHALDPHVWLDPVLAQQEVKTITEGICQVDTQQKEYYTKNSQRYLAKLKKLDEDYQNGLKEASQRTFVTQHAAFGYLAKRYQLQQVSITGLSNEEEPSPASLAKIEDFVKEKKITTIYTEYSSSNKIGKTLSEATGAKLASLHTLEGLSKKEKDHGKDYVKVMEDNLNALQLSIK